jgi:hypothetical protein
MRPVLATFRTLRSFGTPPRTDPSIVDRPPQIEEVHVQVAQQQPQIPQPLRMAQRDMQHLVRDPGGLLAQRQGVELRSVVEKIAIGSDRRRRLRGRVSRVRAARGSSVQAASSP